MAAIEIGMQGEYTAESKTMVPALRKRRRRKRRVRIDGRTITARRIRELTAQYLTALGDVSPDQRERCERAAQLVALAEDVRRKALAGRSVSLEDVIRVENAADRARRAIGLPDGNAEPEPVTIADYLRERAAKASELA